MVYVTIILSVFIICFTIKCIWNEKQQMKLEILRLETARLSKEEWERWTQLKI